MLLSIHSLLLTFITLLAGFVAGDAQVVKPKANSEFSGSSGTISIDIQWMDNNAYPPFDKVDHFLFQLQNGPNTNIQKVKVLKDNVSPDDITQGDDGTYSYTVEFDSSITGDGQYYIQVFSALDADNKQYTINYSPRFELTDMKGTTTVTFTDTTQPVGQTRAQTGTTAASIDTRSFTLQYTQQTGISRFAPMQMQPVTKITATTWTRKFATSAVTYYSSLINSLQQETTITPGWSYTLPSGMNMATPAPYPSDNGGWKDPKERQSLSTRKINLRKRALFK